MRLHTHILLRLLWLLSLLLPFLRASAQSAAKADSIMERVYAYPLQCGLTADSYSADLYVRYLMETKRKNILMRYLPGMFPLESGERTYLGENHVRYSHSGTTGTDWHNVAAYGTMPRLRRGMRRVDVERLKFSIYEPYLSSDRMLSPFHRSNRRFYRFGYLNEFTDSLGRVCAILSVTPRFKNTYLVKGTAHVDVATGAVRELSFNYYYNLTRYSLTATSGDEGIASLLPERLSFYSSTKFFGSKVKTYMEGQTRYTTADLLCDPLASAASKYDLSDRYRLRLDTTRLITGRAHFDSIRPFPLTLSEQAVYDRAAVPVRDTAAPAAPPKKWQRIFSPSTSRLFLESHRVRLGKGGGVKLPAIITPSMLQWSKSGGIALRTSLSLDYSFPKGQRLSLSPRVGYAFKQERFYWNVPFSVLMAPRSGLRMSLAAGGGDYVYSSEQADDIRQQLSGVTNYDSLVNVFDNYKFDYYRVSYVRGDVSVSPLAGLTVTGGVRYNRRNLMNWNSISEKTGMRRFVNSFAPRLHVEWTPCQRYYWRNNRRVLLHSPFPKFLLDYERGIKVFDADSKYERLEADIKYRLPFHAMRSLYLRLGGGFYTLRGDTYFLDYDYFRDNQMPEGWEDEMSGRFHLLPAPWYNESRYYARFCASYESPMLALSRLKPLYRFVRKERIYCNLLVVEHLNAYAELGYGISTCIGDFGAFVGLTRGETLFGCKYIMRLFEED